MYSDADLVEDLIKKIEEKAPDFMRPLDLIEIGIYSSHAEISTLLKKGFAPPYMRLGQKKVIFPKKTLCDWLRKRAEYDIRAQEKINMMNLEKANGKKERAERVNKWWASVDLRLPRFFEYVLVSGRKKDADEFCISIAIYALDHWIMLMEDEETANAVACGSTTRHNLDRWNLKRPLKPDEITHWMSLPNSPKIRNPIKD
jgi:hypothetical protein